MLHKFEVQCSITTSSDIIPLCSQSLLSYEGSPFFGPHFNTSFHYRCFQVHYYKLIFKLPLLASITQSSNYFWPQCTHRLHQTSKLIQELIIITHLPKLPSNIIKWLIHQKCVHPQKNANS